MQIFSRGAAAFVWALVGVTSIFLISIYRLGQRGIQTVTGGLTPVEWGALVVLTAVFVYTEGHRAIQKRFTPHMIDRLRELRATQSLLDVVLAPFYALTLFNAPRRAMIRTWAGVTAIVAMIFIVRAFPEPWRGITDLAVSVALTWGLTAIILATARMQR